ncbi:esterase, partial [Pseudomonas syringae pv. actinidiae]|nr:esterase [Pseudomonas syringae pv. actinidiae]
LLSFAGFAPDLLQGIDLSVL